MMKTLKLTLKGTRPLLVNNPQTTDKLNDWTRRIAEVSGKSKRTDDEERQLQRLKWQAALYHDPDLGPYLPSVSAWKSIHDASKLSKQGKQVERGFTTTVDKMAVEYDGPRDIEGMWASRRFCDVRDAAIRGKKIMAARPIFNEWRLRFEGVFDPDQVNERDLMMFAELAGRLIGIGTYRQRFGRYEVST